MSHNLATGKWYADEGGRCVWFQPPQTSIDRPLPVLIASVHTNDESANPIAHRKANADVLSASFDLLEALEEIVNTPNIGGKGGLHKARAAIAKARGQA